MFTKVTIHAAPARNMRFSLTILGTSFIVVFCISAAGSTEKVELTGPPLPDRPFLSVWNVPSENCAKKWNVSLNLSSFDIVFNHDMSWRGKFIVIFYKDQIGLYPYFDDNGTAVNGGLPQVSDDSLGFGCGGGVGTRRGDGWLESPGGGLPYIMGGDAHREISNEPLKGTNLGVA